MPNHPILLPSTAHAHAAVSSIRLPRPRRIALAFPFSQAHLHLMTRGITDFARKHARWILTTSAEQATLPIESLRGWKGDGVIATITNAAEKKVALQLRKRGIHVITVSSALRDSGMPRVHVDNLAIGNLAAEHLLACGFRNFAFYGLRHVAYSADRGTAFADRIRTAGWPCTIQLAHHAFGQLPWQYEVPRLDQWIQGLQCPIGVFAVNDYRARLLIDACQARQLKIPQDIGILGADNNQVVCEYTEPNLSSIIADWYTHGYQAAQMLDSLINRKRLPSEDITIAPVGIARRASTDITLAHNPHVALVLAYVRDHIGDVFGVEKMVTVSGVSRRALEVLFSRQLQMTPYHYLCVTRVQRAKELLAAATPLKLATISARCGFLDTRRFRIVFRRHEKVTPAQYRTAQKVIPKD